jgi:curved DNA-binding protein CbpA
MATELAKRIPQVVEDVDVRALPLGAVEGFVLSRVDGVLTIDELGEITGLGADAVGGIVLRLMSLGALTWAESPQPTARRAEPTAAERPAQRSGDSTSGSAAQGAGAPAADVAAGSRTPRGVPRALYDPIELEEDVDLERERRRQILDTYYQLEVWSYYRLLGIAPDADKSAIRTAYFELSRVFHPDTMFRKRLGSYKPKMEAIFRRLTEAYQVLGKAKLRAAYDEYLSVQSVTAVTQRELAVGEQVAARAAAQVGLTPARGVSARPNAVPPPPVSPASTPPPPRTGPASANVPSTPAPEPRPGAPSSDRAASTDEQRRRALELQQFRFRGLARPPGAEANAPKPHEAAPTPKAPEATARAERPPSGPPGSREAARDVAGRGLVQALHQAAQLTGGADLVARHLADGLRAERDGQLVEAVNALSLAHAVAPEREDIVREQMRVRRLLAVELADKYAKQADYEERHGKWSQAALSWARVCEGRTDDREAHRRTAEALLRSNGDLHRARAYAQRAVELAPDDPSSRILLARIFVAAGLPLNARRELEHAAKLDPGSEVVKNLLRELR